MANYCEDCGSKVYGGHCTNCHAETFIAEQYRELGEKVPESIAKKEAEQSYDERNWRATQSKGAAMKAEREEPPYDK